MQQWIFLAGAILFEVMATSALKASESFTRLGPSTLVLTGYAASFYLMSLTLKSLPVGVVYAIWSGAGITLIALIGWIFLGQALDKAALAGIALIVSGVLVIYLFSGQGPH